MPWTDDLSVFLALAEEELSTPGAQVMDAMSRLCGGLWWFRSTEPAQWQARSDAAVRHPLRTLVHQDPFTYRSFVKPRGYAGDAALLDMIYYDQGHGVPHDVSALGACIYWHNRDAPAPRAVRERRNHLAHLVDSTALRSDHAQILAVACGHLREGYLSSAIMHRQIGRIIAFDQDAASLDVVRKAFGARVETRLGTLRHILRGDMEPGQFDCIYAAGLYDYLERPLATRLTASLYRLLKPGGELTIANFVPDILDAGYMETFMGWRLIYRTPGELHDLTDELPAAVQRAARVYFLGSPDICYLSVRAE